MTIATIYVLEDNEDICSLYRRELTAADFTVATFGTIAEFTDALQESICDLCILDLSLPDGDALSTLRNLVARYALPAIIVSGRGSVADKILALDFGADDYLVKPVDMLELTARVKSLIRRANQSVNNAGADKIDHERYFFAGWQADFSRLKLFSPDRQEQDLSAADANLLRAFVKSPGKILNREFLLDICQIEERDVYDRSIDVRISRLRKKLQDDPRNPVFIKTVYGAGYLFTPRVTREADQNQNQSQNQKV